MIELGHGTATSVSTPDAFFKKRVDHDTWPEWSPDTEWVELHGPLRLGTRGVLKPKGGPKTKFFISALVENQKYTDTSILPGARLVFEHVAVQKNSLTELWVSVTVKGPLAWLWAVILGNGFKDTAQSDLDRLVRVVESGQ